MFTSIEFLSSYISQHNPRHTKTRHLCEGPGSDCHISEFDSVSFPLGSLQPPPAYGVSLPPPSYKSALGGLSLVDRSDHSFKIYYRDLLSLYKEWSRRKLLKADSLRFVEGGPFLAPRRIADMRDLFMSIVEHKTCPTIPEIGSCDCRSVRWALLKHEWCEVLLLMGNIVL
ncbi:hypothetical protein DFH28DRAFT_1031641 [Melampsora americana]|nr:hypothetical protein DFH28DRAFT_1031641 [Melampsora americana]